MRYRGHRMLPNALLLMLLAACSPSTPEHAAPAAARPDATVGAVAAKPDASDTAPPGRKRRAAKTRPSVTIGGENASETVAHWQPPAVDLQQLGVANARRLAARALEEGRLFQAADDAIPLYLAILAQSPGDGRAATPAP